MNVENIVKIDWVDDICNNYFFVLKVYLDQTSIGVLYNKK